MQKKLSTTSPLIIALLFFIQIFKLFKTIHIDIHVSDNIVNWSFIA